MPYASSMIHTYRSGNRVPSFEVLFDFIYCFVLSLEFRARHKIYRYFCDIFLLYFFGICRFEYYTVNIIRYLKFVCMFG